MPSVATGITQQVPPGRTVASGLSQRSAADESAERMSASADTSSENTFLFSGGKDLSAAARFGEKA